MKTAQTGTLFIISAPSGAGKSSLINSLLNGQPSYSVKASISHTTRKIRPGEVHAESYYFIDHPQFEAMIAQNQFLEHAFVYGQYYGTSRLAVEDNLKNGIDVILDIDWQGARQVRENIANTRSIFILPPSREELERRLYQRGQDSEDVIKKRMQKAVDEMSHYHEYDYLIINDDFDTALHDLKAIIRAERLHLERQNQKHTLLISKLLAE